MDTTVHSLKKRRTSTKSTSFVVVVVFSIIISLVTIYALVAFDRFVYDRLYESIEEELDEIVSHQQITIKSENAHNISALTLLSNSISTNNFSSTQEIQAYLAMQKPNLTFQELYYVDSSGVGVSTLGTTKDFSDSIILSTILSTGSFASQLNSNSTISNGIMDLAVPVLSGDTITGMLVGENHINYLFAELERTIGDKGHITISNSEGKALVSSSDTPLALDQLTNEDITFFEGSANEIYTNLANNQQGIAYFQRNNINKVIRYAPLEFGGLHMSIIVDESKMQTGIQDISKLVNYISILIVGMFVIFGIYIWHANKNSIRRIEEVAFIDELTGLPNLTKLKKDLRRILTKNQDKVYTIIKVDVQNFKAINEIHGFDVGNRFLKAWKEISEKAPEKTLIVARVGIDEFIFFSGNRFLDQLDASTSYYESFFKQIIPELKNHHLAFNYGRYFIEKGETDVNEIITKVSLAHSMSKLKNENLIWDYDDNYKQKVLNTTEITNKMESAMENGEFHAFLQPKFNIASKKLIGAEALVRWIESDGKMIFPDSFIPVFETNGFIIELDMHILEQVCMLLKSWIDKGYECIPISVNFSRHHLDNDNFIFDVKDMVDKYNVPHHFVEVELTETTLLQSENVLKKFISDLHDNGFTISIDDFGAGYSSLGLLKEFPMDTLKLDKTFIDNTNTNPRGKLVIDGIVKMAHSLEMDIVAEGIEDVDQLNFLDSIDCETAQGYFFEKPISIKQFEDKYKSYLANE